MLELVATVAAEWKESGMCRPVTCKVCGKTTWAGCGQHVDQVKAQVPAGEWCGGHQDEAKPGFVGRIFGR